MKIFVTGGTGFIGSHTILELKKRGHRLLVLSRATHREHGVDFIKGDLSNIEKWKAQLKKFKPEAAIHLAWGGLPDLSCAQSIKNLEEGLALFAALAEGDCKKIVAMGTGYECVNRVGRVSEKINVIPANALTAAKHALHLMGEEIAKERGIDFIWLRPFRPYGVGQRAESLMSYIMRCVVEKIPLTLKNPLAQGDFVYGADIARAIADAVSRGRGHATYNVGSGHLTPVRDIARMVCEEMGASKAYYKDFAETAKGKLIPAAYADLSRAWKDLGWRPVVGIKEGIKRTIAEFKKSQE